MDETFVMDDGTVVPFYSMLSYSGIRVEVKKSDIAESKKDEFLRQLKSERDVVRVRFID